MIARVRPVIFRATSAGSNVNVSGVISAKTTFPPARKMQFVDDTNVKLGTMTSSPGCNRNVSIASSSAWLHEGVNKTCGTFKSSASRADARAV